MKINQGSILKYKKMHKLIKLKINFEAKNSPVGRNGLISIGIIQGFLVAGPSF